MAPDPLRQSLVRYLRLAMAREEAAGTVIDILQRRLRSDLAAGEVATERVSDIGLLCAALRANRRAAVSLAAVCGRSAVRQ